MTSKRHLYTSFGLFNSTIFLSYLLKEHIENFFSFFNDEIYLGLSVSFTNFVKYLNLLFLRNIGIDWNNFSFFTYLFLLFFVLVGSLLPDIDNSNSILGRRLKFISSFIGHRGYTHSIWFLIVLYVFSFVFNSTILYALLLGSFYHILVDSFSRAGICWFYPFSKYLTSDNGSFIKSGRNPIFLYYVTGSIVETIISYIFLSLGVLTIFLFIYLSFVN